MAKMDVNSWKSYENGVPSGEKANSSSSSSQVGGSSSSTPTGPDPAKLKAILDRTNYSHQVTVGQRKYGGPPPDWTAPAPASGCEIFVGRIPKDVYEDELIPLFEKIGPIWDLRLMIDPLTSHSRGYGFITYTNKEDAQKAVQEMNGHKIRSKNFSLKVNISVPNVRLFIGNIPKIMSKEQIFNEFNKITDGLTEVITYSSPDDRKKNRGFCFLEFDSHKNASAAKRKLTTNGMKIFKCDILVDWADPQEEPDEETMSKVKVLYVRNLTSDVTESQLKELFEEYGTIERVKKIKDYAFVHFEDREQALNAMDKVNGREFGGSNIEISLAKPPSDRRKKEEILRNRERRMFAMMQQKQYNMMAFPRVPPSQIRPPLPAIPPPPPMMMRNGGRNRFSQPPHVNPMMAPVAFNRQGLSFFPQSPRSFSFGRVTRPTRTPFSSPQGHYQYQFPPQLDKLFQGQPWNPLLHFYDPSDWWYSGGGGSGGGHHGSGSGRHGHGGHHGPQFPSFPNMPPPGAQWNAYLPNGQVPPLPYGPGSGGDPRGDRRGHHGGRNGPAGHSGPVNGNTSSGGGQSSNPNHRKWRKSSSNQAQQQQQSNSSSSTAAVAATSANQNGSSNKK